MFPYLIDVALTAWISSAILNQYDANGIEQFQNERKRKMLLGLILLLWVLLYAFRGWTGSDSIVYWGNYKNISNHNLLLNDLFNSYRDKLFQVVSFYCSKLSNGSWLFFCLVLGFLTYTPIAHIILKKSPDVNFSCLLYIFTLSSFFAFNGVRQGLSIGFCCLAYYCCLTEKKYIRYAILMLIAYGFHAASLLIIPFHLISLKKLKSISTILIIIFAFVASFFLVGIWGNVLDIFAGDNLVSDYDEMFTDAHGSSIIRVFFWSAPVVLAFIHYSAAQNKFPEIDRDLILSLFGVVFMLYSTQSSHFSQMAPYFNFSTVLFIPKVVRSIPSDSKGLLKGIILGIAFVYMLFMLWNGDLGINPYIPIWESGSY